MLWIIITFVLVVAAIGAPFIRWVDRGYGGEPGKKKSLSWVSLACIPVFLIITGLIGVRTVPIGEARVLLSFNTVIEDEYITEGFHFIAPWMQTSGYFTRRRQVVLVDESTISGSSKGGVHVEEFDVIIPYEINPEHLWMVRKEVGPHRLVESLIYNSARSAARDALANFTWDELSFLKRDEASTWLSNRFMEVLSEDLMASGLPEEAANSVVRAYTAQIREVVVPQTILQANSNLAASRVELERQAVLTDIAAQEADRRANDGLGIQQMWDNLPDASAADIALILDAVSNKTRADALAQAVQDERVTVMVLSGQEASIPAIRQ